MRAVREAERPLLIAGGGVHHSEAEDALRAFADVTGIPVASTQAGKGSLRHDHPADVGGIGHTGTAVADDLARTADLVIGVGTRYTDFTTASGTLFQRPGVRFLNLNITAFDAHKLAARTLVCDARAGLEALTQALAGHRVAGAYEAEYRTGKDRWDEAVQAAYRADDPSAVPTQTQVLGALDAVVGDTDVVINAAGSLPGDLHKLWRARSPRQYHLEYGYSCMGYEIPAAIGVQQAAPDEVVWALVGDGTYLMMPTEIVTAVQEGLPVNMVLVQNHGYASIGGLSESVGGERFGTAYRYRAPRRHLHRRAAPGRPGRQRCQPRHGRAARQDGRRAARRARAGPRLRPADLCVRRDRPGAHRAAGAGLVGRAGRRGRRPGGGRRRPRAVRTRGGGPPSPPVTASSARPGPVRRYGPDPPAARAVSPYRTEGGPR
ncbi:hypothetical protein GCM10020256_06780 [Streptomyces thermocoprophilus]